MRTSDTWYDHLQKPRVTHYFLGLIMICIVLLGGCYDTLAFKWCSSKTKLAKMGEICRASIINMKLEKNGKYLVSDENWPTAGFYLLASGITLGLLKHVYTQSIFPHCHFTKTFQCNGGFTGRFSKRLHFYYFWNFEHFSNDKGVSHKSKYTYALQWEGKYSKKQV